MLAQYFHIRPWEIGLLSVADFDALINYAEEHLLNRDR